MNQEKSQMTKTFIVLLWFGITLGVMPHVNEALPENMFARNVVLAAASVICGPIIVGIQTIKYFEDLDQERNP